MCGSRQRFASFPPLYVAARYCWPVIRTAQAIRAILLASATNGDMGMLPCRKRIHPKTKAALRSIQSCECSSRTLDQQLPQVLVSTLADSEQLRLTAGRALSRNKSQPGGLTQSDYERKDATHRFPGATLVPAYVDIHIHGLRRPRRDGGDTGRASYD
jgi:hypothetical protein